MRSPRRGAGERGHPLPSLTAAEAPRAVLETAGGCGATLIEIAGPSGAGKTVWAEQLEAAAAQLSRTRELRWRVVRVSVVEAERDVPLALAGRIAAAAGARDAAASAVSRAEVAAGVDAALRRGLSARRRLLLVIDNAQWVDADSLHVLQRVLPRLAARDACVVVLGQGDGPAHVAAGIRAVNSAAWPGARELRLAPLDTVQVRQYVSRVHGIAVSLHLAERIGEAAGGLPVLIDQVVGGLRSVWASRAAAAPADRARFDEDIVAGIERRAEAEGTFVALDAGAPAECRAAVEYAAVLGVPMSEHRMREIAATLGETVDVETAVQAGLLVALADPERGDTGELRPFHDLYAKDVVTRTPAPRRAAILEAAAATLSAVSPLARHRSVAWALRAADIAGDGLSAGLRARLAASVDEAVRDRRTEHVLDVMQQAIALAAHTDQAVADELTVELYGVCTALSSLPRMFPFIERLEAMAQSPARDLALLHIREFRGDYDWVAEFAPRALARLPEAPGADAAAAIAADPRLRDGLVVRMQITLVLGLMAPQARPGDFGLAELAEARRLAILLERAAAQPTDRRLRWLPSAHDVLLRATAMSLFGVSAAGRIDLAQDELQTLGEAIASAPVDTPTLFDALLVRAGVSSTIGFVRSAAADLSRCMDMLAAGTGGWGTGTARTLHVMCQYLIGDRTEADAAIAEADVMILDDMDAVGRPAYYAVRAAIAAESGDEDEWETSMRAAWLTAATGHDDTLRAELEAWALIARARLRDDPEAALAVFGDDGPLAGRVLRSQNLYAFKVDALASLGRAEEADRELARLRELPFPGYQPVHGSLRWLEGRVEEAYGHSAEAMRAYRLAAEPGPSRTGVVSDSLPGTTARAALDAGRLLVESGANPSEARRLLRSAQRAFAALGQAPDRDRATSLLDTLSASSNTAPRRRLDGLDALTAREREIALEAARGSTNAEIATLLGVSPSTVAFHVSNTLAKLGLASRRGLREFMADAALSGDREARPLPASWGALTPRQRQVAALAADDLSNAEIADVLAITPRAVAFHMSNILGVLGLSSRRELRSAR